MGASGRQFLIEIRVETSFCLANCLAACLADRGDGPDHAGLLKRMPKQVLQRLVEAALQMAPTRALALTTLLSPAPATV